MALDQSALLKLLGELERTDITDRIRVAAETPYQELIDAEAIVFIGAAASVRVLRNPGQQRSSKGWLPGHDWVGD